MKPVWKTFWRSQNAQNTQRYRRPHSHHPSMCQNVEQSQLDPRLISCCWSSRTAAATGYSWWTPCYPPRPRPVAARASRWCRRRPRFDPPRCGRWRDRWLPGAEAYPPGFSQHSQGLMWLNWYLSGINWNHLESMINGCKHLDRCKSTPVDGLSWPKKLGWVQVSKMAGVSSRNTTQNRQPRVTNPQRNIHLDY